MSTKSLIGIDAGSSVKFVGMHYNSHPENIIPMLEKYSSIDSVEKLISGSRILELESTFEEGVNIQVMPTLGEPAYFFQTSTI